MMKRMRPPKYVPLPFLMTLVITLVCGCGKFFPNNTNSGGGSGGGGGGTPGANFLYVADSTVPNPPGGAVAAFSVGSGGALTALNNSTAFSVAAAPAALAVTPNSTFLYVGGQSGVVNVYTINTDGSLVIGNNGGAVATGFSPVSMAIDSTGTWFFAVDSNSGTLFDFQITPSTGVLTQASVAAVQLDQGVPNQVYIAPNNQFLYVALQTGGVDVFTFNSTTGALSTPVLLRPLTAGQNSDTAVRADPQTKFLFAAETGVNGVRVFTIGSNGGLTELAGSPFKTGLGPAALAMDAAGAYLYVANRGANNISAFSLGITGSLTAVTGSPFAAGTSPTAVTLDQTGNFLAVVSTGGAPDLQLFSFDATIKGKLDSVATAQTGTAPTNALAIASAK